MQTPRLYGAGIVYQNVNQNIGIDEQFHKIVDQIAEQFRPIVYQMSIKYINLSTNLSINLSIKFVDQFCRSQCCSFFYHLID